MKAIISIASGIVNLTVSFVLAAVGMFTLVLKAAVSTAIGGILTVALIVAAIVVIVLALGCGQTAEPGQTARATDTPSPAVAASTPTTAQGTPLPDTTTPRAETVSASPETKTPAAAKTATIAPDTSTPRAETVSATPEPKTPATAPTATAAPQSSGGQPTPRPETATPTPERKTANPIATSTPPPTSVPTPEREYEIVTLLPPDAIPSISNPSFVSAEEAGDEYGPDELVLGVEIDGDARAYSVPLLSRHEIVNDVVGGKPIAVTW